MKKLMALLGLTLSLFLIGCSEDHSAETIRFATSADTPPFEFYDHGKIQGFDMDLAQLIAKTLKKEAVIQNMHFSNILPALATGRADAAIAVITMTEERKKNFSFSEPYYTESIAAIFRKDFPIRREAELATKKIACQLGTTMEIWARKHLPHATIITMDTNNQAIESLKIGHIDAVLVDTVQAAAFTQKNPSLGYLFIAQSEDGYAIAFPKESPLKEKVNQALTTLKAQGELQKLEEKWMHGMYKDAP